MVVRVGDDGRAVVTDRDVRLDVPPVRRSGPGDRAGELGLPVLVEPQVDVGADGVGGIGTQPVVLPHHRGRRAVVRGRDRRVGLVVAGDRGRVGPVDAQRDVRDPRPHVVDAGVDGPGPGLGRRCAEATALPGAAVHRGHLDTGGGGPERGAAGVVGADGGAVPPGEREVPAGDRVDREGAHVLVQRCPLGRGAAVGGEGQLLAGRRRGRADRDRGDPRDGQVELGHHQVPRLVRHQPEHVPHHPGGGREIGAADGRGDGLGRRARRREPRAGGGREAARGGEHPAGRDQRATAGAGAVADVQPHGERVVGVATDDGRRGRDRHRGGGQCQAGHQGQSSGGSSHD